MFFAVDTPNNEALARCLRWFHEALCEDRRNAHLLLDLAFDQTALNTRSLRDLERISLYDGTALAGLSHVGLTLVALPDNAVARNQVIESLLVRAENKPMWSVLVSTATPRELSEQLAPCLQAETADGLRWPVRWGDTRVLGHLLERLTALETQTWLKHVITWSWFDRWARWRTWESGLQQPAGSSHTPQVEDRLWQLDDVRFTYLAECSEVDQILSQIDDHRPHILKPWQPAQAHDRVAEAMNACVRYVVTAAPDRLALATMALTLDAGFTAHPAFVQALHAIPQGQSFQAVIERLPASFWDECALTQEPV